MPNDLTSRQKFLLAAMAAHQGADFAPVQVQKLFFLLDENIANDVGGRQFDFRPYDYGPFDRTVYEELERLAARGLVSVIQNGPAAGARRYSLTPTGFDVGQTSLRTLPSRVQEYMRVASNWVRSLSFARLVGSIYKSFPHMRANSVFQD